MDVDRQQFSPGDLVRVVQGPFTDNQGTVSRVQDGGLIEVFGCSEERNWWSGTFLQSDIEHVTLFGFPVREANPGELPDIGDLRFGPPLI